MAGGLAKDERSRSSRRLFGFTNTTNGQNRGTKSLQRPTLYAFDVQTKSVSALIVAPLIIWSIDETGIQPSPCAALKTIDESSNRFNRVKDNGACDHRDPWTNRENEHVRSPLISSRHPALQGTRTEKKKSGLAVSGIMHRFRRRSLTSALTRVGFSAKSSRGCAHFLLRTLSNR